MASQRSQILQTNLGHHSVRLAVLVKNVTLSSELNKIWQARAAAGDAAKKAG